MSRLLGGALLTVLLASGTACDRSGTQPDPEPSRCDVGLAVPDGFRVTGGIQDPYPDRVGVRIDLEGDHGRELHYFAGIPGEFGEGLPDHGAIPVRGGGTGHLIGRDTTWVLAWGSGSPCTPVVVLGTGMDRREFTEAASAAGALPDGPT